MFGVMQKTVRKLSCTGRRKDVRGDGSDEGENSPSRTTFADYEYSKLFSSVAINSSNQPHPSKAPFAVARDF